MTPLPISVIVCVKDREPYIKRCLASVLANSPGEVIVVDGGSSDRTVEIAQAMGATVLKDEGKGLAFARQLGADSTRCPYLAYVDSDVELAPDCLGGMLEELEATGWGGIHALVSSPETRNYWEWAQDQHFQMTFNKPGPRAAIGTIAALFRSDVVKAVRFAPEMTGASEDGDFSARVLRSGHKLGVSRAGTCHHHHRSDFRSFWKQRRWYGAGTLRLARRERSWPRALAPLAFPFYGIALSIVRGRPGMIPYFLINGMGYAIGMADEALRGTVRKSHLAA